MLRPCLHTFSHLRQGLCFYHNGDAVLWYWPWSGRSYTWYSLLVEEEFDSLCEMQEFCEAYRKVANEAFLVKSLIRFLGKKGLSFFRRVYKEYGRVDVVLQLDGDIPHPIHFREGMLIRNYLREITEYSWDIHEYDYRWTTLIEKAIQKLEKSTVEPLIVYNPYMPIFISNIATKVIKKVAVTPTNTISLSKYIIKHSEYPESKKRT